MACPRSHSESGVKLKLDPMSILGSQGELMEPGLCVGGWAGGMSAEGKSPLLPGHWMSLCCLGDKAAT